jgi:hypothetical protein
MQLYSECQRRLTISDAFFSTNGERGRRQRLLDRITELLRIPKSVIEKLKKKRIFQTNRLFGSTIASISKV